MSKSIPDHPNILKIDKCYIRKSPDYCTFTAYYEMSLADNTLEKLINENFFKNKIPETKKLALSCLNGLIHMSNHGVNHLDIKPQNILVWFGYN